MQKMTSSDFDPTSTIQKICCKLKDSQLAPLTLKPIKQYLKKMNKFLNHDDDNKTILFCVIFIQNYLEMSSDLGDIMIFLDLDKMKFIELKPSLDSLMEKRLIYSFYSSSMRQISKFSYENLTVNPDVLEAIRLNIPLTEETIKLQDIFTLCGKVSDLIEDRNKDKITTRALFHMIEQLECENQHLTPIHELKKLNISIGGRTLLYEMCDDLVRDPSSGRTGLEVTIKDIYDNTRVRIQKVREIVDHESELDNAELIIMNNGTFINDLTISLTNKSIHLLLGDDAKIFIQKRIYKNLISVDKIISKELFFDASLSNQLMFFKNSLAPQNLNALQERLSEMALNKGVTAVFYGAPGTGKTESVYQIAKETGRDVYLVDISQTKSMWMGESEKRVKGIFNMYRQICKNSEITPILLFNEADGVLTQRKENSMSNVSNTENAMQNIILEEMEHFDGIMIATTNLINNLDSAFERRFIFKVEFHKPSEEAKMKIWQNKLKWIDSADAYTLSNKYTFSGGEIDNVVRKAILNEVLTGERPCLDDVITYCETERFATRLSKVGY